MLPKFAYIRPESMTEALEQLAIHKPDLAIVDVSLPDGNGLELIKRMRLRSPETYAPARPGDQGNAHAVAPFFMSSRAMIMRWIWFVPS